MYQSLVARVMTSSGQSVRIRVSDIRETGRNAQGVRLMNLSEGETIQDVATVIPDEEDADAAKAEGEEAGTEQPAAEEQPPAPPEA